MKFPTRYTAHERTEDFGTYASEASKTKQEFKDECDINSIMRRYITKGILPANIKVGRYGDFAEVGDYRESLEILQESRVQFMALPSAVRARFHNNPAELLAFVMDKSNADEARRLGLLKEEPVAAPPVVAAPTVVPPAPAVPAVK